MADARQKHVILDLASCVGTLQYVGGKRLPRGKQTEPQVERYVAGRLVRAIGGGEGVAVGEIRSHRPDPPDVIAEYGNLTIGIETTELMPSYRLEKDAIIQQLRRDALAQISVGPQTRDLAFNVHCRDDYVQRFRPGRWVGPQLGKCLATFLEGEVLAQGTLTLPAGLRAVVKSISYFRDESVPTNSLIQRKDEPLILFGAQHTPIDPVIDFPHMVAARLDRKCQHNLDRPTWLLLWSEHHAMEQFQADVVTAVRSYFTTRSSPYERIFYFHCGAAKIYEIMGGQVSEAEISVSARESVAPTIEEIDNRRN